MQTWLNFWLFFFWLILLSFLFNNNNFVFLLIFSELIWIILYIYTILVGTINDDLNSLTLSFFILGFASVEFCFGFLLIILFRTINKSINLNSDELKIQNYFYTHTQKLVKIQKTWNLNN